MIQELKRKPITYNGVDGWEVLLKDDEIYWDEVWVCERCMYFNWDGGDDITDPCDIVHDCLNDYQKYYKFEKK